MKKAITAVFILLLLATIILFFIELYSAMEYHNEHDDIFGSSFDLTIGLMLILPLILAEIDIYRQVMYFLSNRSNRRTYKTIFAILSLLLSAGIILTYTYDAMLYLVLHFFVDIFYILWAIVAALLLLKITRGIVSCAIRRREEERRP